MFYSLMAILHEKLPCATNFFRLRKKFREKNLNENGSPIRTIASPKMMRGLSIGKTQRAGGGTSERGHSPNPSINAEIRIRNQKDINSRRPSANSSNMKNVIGSAGQPSKQSLIEKHKESN